MDTSMNYPTNRKLENRTTRSLIRKISLVILLVLFLTTAILAGSVQKASAQQNSAYNDGNGCLWWNVDGVWIGQCYQAATTTWGYLWAYYGYWQEPWVLAGIYDATHDYYYNYTGGYASRIERTTGLLTYPSDCGWIDAYTTCGYVGGSTTPANPVIITIGGAPPTDPFLAGVNADIIGTWLQPNCTGSYNGC